ncbi:NAD(P)-dependent oxidoreductase [Streptosporangium sp. NPDC006007]|uniref:NAD(P)-dependent oxidoreductase n=1 Tax=Streptosporangium sp. NPDC006007 TaxID=3154575 RepID=UPI0033BCF3E4
MRAEPTVAVFGAGVMAGNMIGALHRAGFPLRLFNRTPSRLDAVAPPGSVMAASPRQAAQGADMVISVVTDDEASRAVWLGEAGALRGASPDTVAVECSTLSRDWVTTWAATVREHGVQPIDAPVTGSRSRAAEGSLVMFASGTSTALNQARPVLDAMTERIYDFGSTVGTATAFKLINNMLAGSMLVAFAEAFALAGRAGLDLAQVLEIQSTYGWATGIAAGKGRNMLLDAHDDVHCRLALLAKDLAYALELTELDLPLSSAAKTQLAAVATSGDGMYDMSAIIRAYRKE